MTVTSPGIQKRLQCSHTCQWPMRTMTQCSIRWRDWDLHGPSSRYRRYYWINTARNTYNQPCGHPKRWPHWWHHPNCDSSVDFKHKAKATLYLNHMTGPKQGRLMCDKGEWTFIPGRSTASSINKAIALPEFLDLAQSMVTNKYLFQGWRTRATPRLNSQIRTSNFQYHGTSRICKRSQSHGGT